MSMFSTHYLIRCGKNPGALYWNGDNPATPFGWGDYRQAVRFHGRASAEAVINGVLCEQQGCEVEEDE